MGCVALIIALLKEGHVTLIKEMGCSKTAIPSDQVILTVEELFRTAKARQKKLWLTTCGYLAVKVKLSVSSLSHYFHLIPLFSSTSTLFTFAQDCTIFFVASMAPHYPTSSGLRTSFSENSIGTSLEEIFRRGHSSCDRPAKRKP